MMISSIRGANNTNLQYISEFKKKCVIIKLNMFVKQNRNIEAIPLTKTIQIQFGKLLLLRLDKQIKLTMFFK